MPTPETLYTSRWLSLHRINQWEYVRRPQSEHAVGILATTPNHQIILIEQFRIPLQKHIIELPAGIVGDEPDFLHESLADTAHRELLEETGFHAQHLTHLLTSPTSAGMTSELTHLFHATQLTHQHQGGGTPSENITTHLIPLTQLRHFLTQQSSLGKLIDSKIYAALAAANIPFA